MLVIILTKAYVPLREKPDLSGNQPFQSAVSQSIETWVKILPKLQQRAIASIVTDDLMKARFEAAKAFLPLEDEAPQPQSTSTPFPPSSANNQVKAGKTERDRAIAQEALKYT